MGHVVTQTAASVGYTAIFITVVDVVVVVVVVFVVVVVVVVGSATTDPHRNENE